MITPWVTPVILEGRVVRLEPLEERHAGDLVEVAEPDIFRYIPNPPASQSLEGLCRLIREAHATPDRCAWAIIVRKTGLAIGSSSYLEIRPPHRGLEIGWSWIGRLYQGTKVNPEAKHLMLRHAFETLGAIRVQLKTDARNLQSRRNIEKLGARCEGVLRKHIIMPDGYYRDTVIYSIIEDEWPAVKSRLEDRLSYTQP